MLVCCDAGRTVANLSQITVIKIYQVTPPDLLIYINKSVSNLLQPVVSSSVDLH